MSVDATYDLFASLLLIAYGAVIAIPAWAWWTRNLRLVRTGVKTTGRYQGDCLVAFQVEPDRQETFSTWRAVIRRANIGDELPVLYDPAYLHKAEVLTPAALWHIPMNHLVLAASSFLAVILIWRGTNLALALLVSMIVGPLGSICVRLAFYALYPPCRLDRFNEEKTSADSASPEPFPGPGKAYSRQQRRLRRQQDWKAQSRNQENNDSSLPGEDVPAKRRDARDQLLLDMISPSDRELHL